jgi:hypothetical protein
MRWRLTSFLDEMENVAPVCILLHRKANNQTKVINGEKMHQQLESASTLGMVMEKFINNWRVALIVGVAIESYLGLEADASGFEISHTRLHVIGFL